MNGKQHLIGNMIVAAAGTLYLYDKAPELLLPAIAGFALGIVAGPDVRDQEQVRNEGEWVVTRLMGRTIGTLFTAYWWPLAALIPHRHALSHTPFLGTLIAMLYLLLPPLIAYGALNGNMPLVAFIERAVQHPWAIPVYAAWAAQDIAHWVQDQF